MKILITGGSSFTGYWFIRELAAAGHEVFATFTRSGAEQYDELRARRINETVKLCNPVWNCAFGDDVFRRLIEQEKNWDLLCHHGAFVQDYKSIDFDVTSAVMVAGIGFLAGLEETWPPGVHPLPAEVWRGVAGSAVAGEDW